MAPYAGCIFLLKLPRRAAAGSLAPRGHFVFSYYYIYMCNNVVISPMVSLIPFLYNNKPRCSIYIYYLVVVVVVVVVKNVNF